MRLSKGLASLCATALITAISPVSIQATASYEWKNAQIVGGGFIPGIVFSSQKGVAVPTDVMSGAPAAASGSTSSFSCC